MIKFQKNDRKLVDLKLNLTLLTIYWAKIMWFRCGHTTSWKWDDALPPKLLQQAG